MWTVRAKERSVQKSSARSSAALWKTMMSRFLKFTAFGVRQEQGRGVHPDRSDSGVDVTVRGWKQGLNKVRLTQTLRDGGMGLDAAIRTTGAILAGREVDRKSTRLNSSHVCATRMPPSA